MTDSETPQEPIFKTMLEQLMPLRSLIREIHLTKAGYDRMKSELRDLYTVRENNFKRTDTAVGTAAGIEFFCSETQEPGESDGRT